MISGSACNMIHDKFTGLVYPKSNPRGVRFYGCLRDWNPAEGHEAPDELVYEIQTIGDPVMVACGKTLQEAKRKLEGHLDRQTELDSSSDLID